MVNRKKTKEEYRVKDGDAIDVYKRQVGETIFFSAAKPDIANKALDIVRRYLGKLLNLYDESELAFCWIVDFPMFERTLT